MPDVIPSGADSTAVGREPDEHAQLTLELASAALRTAVLWGAITLAIAAGVSTILFAVPGLLGALVGGAVAFISTLTTILMMRKTAGSPPMLVMVVALGGYLMKIIVLFGVMTLLRDVTFLHTVSLALTMLAVIFVGAVAEFAAFRRMKVPTVIPQ